MNCVIVDVESDGPIPAEFSMVCFGAVIFDDSLEKNFYGRTRPISERFDPEALAVSGFSREQHLGFDDPKAVMENFAAWLEDHVKGRPVFVSDNPAYRLAVHQLLFPPLPWSEPLRYFRPANRRSLRRLGQGCFQSVGVEEISSHCA